MNKIENQNDNSTIIADLILTNLEISQMRRKMFFINDISARIPKLTFSILNNDKESIYSKLKNILETYRGNVLWTLQYPQPGEQKENLYAIIPQRIANKKLLERGPANKNEVSMNSELGYLGVEYEDFCIRAINDIEHLNEHIKSYMKW